MDSSKKYFARIGVRVVNLGDLGKEKINQKRRGVQKSGTKSALLCSFLFKTCAFVRFFVRFCAFLPLFFQLPAFLIDFFLTQIPQFNHPDPLSCKIFFTAIGLKKPKIHLSRMIYLFEKVFLFSKYSRIQWLL